MLRSENERLKNQFDNMRKEKSNEISKVRNELSMKMTELEKTILDLRSQLQFKVAHLIYFVVVDSNEFPLLP